MDQSIIDSLTGLSNSSRNSIENLKRIVVCLLEILVANKTINKKEYNKILKML